MEDWSKLQELLNLLKDNIHLFRKANSGYLLMSKGLSIAISFSNVDIGTPFSQIYISCSESVTFTTCTCSGCRPAIVISNQRSQQLLLELIQELKEKCVTSIPETKIIPDGSPEQIISEVLDKLRSSD